MCLAGIRIPIGGTYGEGCYFAALASTSHRYAKKSAYHSHFMFLAKVLVGPYAPGRSEYRRSPLKDPSNPASDLYDSKNPKILVVFHNDQYCSEYLIKYISLEGKNAAAGIHNNVWQGQVGGPAVLRVPRPSSRTRLQGSSTSTNVNRTLNPPLSDLLPFPSPRLPPSPPSPKPLTKETSNRALTNPQNKKGPENYMQCPIQEEAEKFPVQLPMITQHWVHHC